MSTNLKTSLLIPSQLPDFIRGSEDYSKFVAFIQAYYEWMEQEGEVIDQSKNLLQYRDVDETIDRFVKYFVNDFLPYFPQDALVDQRQAVKIAKTLYESKGTPASYQFLFRILYNSDFDYYNTSDAVLYPSSGTWYVPKSLKLLTTDPNFLNIDNLILFGEDSKSYATVENSIPIVNNTRIQVYITGIDRKFHSGEYVRVLDGNRQDYLINGQPLRAKIVGELGSVKVRPDKRGLNYVKGDPVIISGGLSAGSSNDAIARISSATTGSLEQIFVLNGGHGFNQYPLGNSTITITGVPDGAAIVIAVLPYANQAANVSLVSTNMIGNVASNTIGQSMYSFFKGNPTANANTTLANALDLYSFTAYPLAANSVIVTNPGHDVAKKPKAVADSTYVGDYLGNIANLKNLGILAPIKIRNAGAGYVANDVIVFNGGSGYGANAVVNSVSSNGSIVSVKFVPGKGNYPLGGMGYTDTTLPTLSVRSANNQASNASLYISGVMGGGVVLEPITSRVGLINSIELLFNGTDYIATPNVSLRVEDILISNAQSVLSLPTKGDTLYQGDITNVAAFKATVNSVSLLTTNKNDFTKNMYSVRVFDYHSIPDPSQALKLLNANVNNLKMMPKVGGYAANTFFKGSPEFDDNGVKVYGDGNARADAIFFNGVVSSPGRYVDSKGQLSSFDVLQNGIYNSFTYEITVKKEIAKYRNILLNLLHPSGTNVLGRYQMDSANAVHHHIEDALFQGHTLYYYTNRAAANATMITDATNKSNNIIQLNNLGTGTNIAAFVFPNTYVAIQTTNGPNVFAKIITVNQSTNTFTVDSNTWLTYPNVANVVATTSTNTINILSLTGAYDIINNGKYSNPVLPLKDIVFAGDTVIVPNNTQKVVSSVDYVNGIITLSSNLSANSNGYMTVIRNFVAGGTYPNAQQIIFYGPTGTQYFSELSTEDGYSITTEDARNIILG
jgi:hypothetical protein